MSGGASPMENSIEQQLTQLTGQLASSRMHAAAAEDDITELQEQKTAVDSLLLGLLHTIDDDAGIHRTHAQAVAAQALQLSLVVQDLACQLRESNHAKADAEVALERERTAHKQAVSALDTNAAQLSSLSLQHRHVVVDLESQVAQLKAQLVLSQTRAAAAEDENAELQHDKSAGDELLKGLLQTMEQQQQRLEQCRLRAGRTALEAAKQVQQRLEECAAACIRLVESPTQRSALSGQANALLDSTVTRAVTECLAPFQAPDAAAGMVSPSPIEHQPAATPSPSKKDRITHRRRSISVEFDQHKKAMQGVSIRAAEPETLQQAVGRAAAQQMSEQAVVVPKVSECPIHLLQEPLYEMTYLLVTNANSRRCCFWARLKLIF